MLRSHIRQFLDVALLPDTGFLGGGNDCFFDCRGFRPFLSKRIAGKEAKGRKGLAYNFRVMLNVCGIVLIEGFVLDVVLNIVFTWRRWVETLFL